MAEIAILLATYNGEKYIQEFLDSLMSQTFEDFICYIHDDGSNDGTVKIISQYALRYKEKFKILDYESKGSAAENFISLLRFAKEPYVMFADQDDVWLDDKIEKTYKEIKKLNNREKANAVYTDLKVVDYDLSEISPSYYKLENRDPYATDIKQLLKRNVAAGCTMMINSKLVDICNRFPSLMELTLHDWGAVILAKLYGEVKFIDEPTILYRQHESNTVGAKNKNGILYFINEVKKLLIGEKFRYIKESIKLEQSLVKEIYSIIEPNNSYYEFISAYTEILKESKVKRIVFYCKNKLISTSLIKIWRVLFV